MREIWALPPNYFEVLDQAAREQAVAVQDAAMRKLTRSLVPSIKITSNIMPGAPRSVILEEADRWKADLIVVGSHGYGAWHRLLLGSVSQGIVSHAKCSVEVVRRPDLGRAKEVKAA
jgi:nucleotide-binding universal stress UspA family protein